MRLMKKYSDETRAYIAENVMGRTTKELAALVNAEFNTDFTESKMQAYKKNHKLKSGLRGHFKKGCIPFNKGLKRWWTGGEETRFKRGQMPWNYKPIGSERVNSDGYVDIKIQDGKNQKNWRGKHVVMWEAHHGRSAPKGHAVIFADGSRRNFDPDNLLLVSRAQLVRMNQSHMIKSDAEMTKTGVIIADIISKISEKKRRKNDE